MPNRTLGCAQVERHCEPNSPDLGCARSPTMLLRFEVGWNRPSEIRAPAPEAARAVWQSATDACTHQQRLGIPKMSSLIVPRRQFLQGLASAVVCAPAVVRASSLMAVSARFSVSAGPRSAMGDAPRKRSPAAARNGASIRRNAVWPEGLSAEAEDAVPTRSPVVAEAKITHCGSCEPGSDLEVRRPNRSKSCPLKCGPRLLDVGPLLALALDRARGFRGFASRKARCAPFDNPLRSWNMNPHGPSIAPEGEKGTR